MFNLSSELLYRVQVCLGSSSESIAIVNKWEKRPTDFILGIILNLRTVIQIDIIYFCLQKRATGSGPLYPIMGFGQISSLFDYNGGNLLKQN